MSFTIGGTLQNTPWCVAGEYIYVRRRNTRDTMQAEDPPPPPPSPTLYMQNSRAKHENGATFQSLESVSNVITCSNVLFFFFFTPERVVKYPLLDQINLLASVEKRIIEAEHGVSS